jgi:hypothetical protein
MRHPAPGARQLENRFGIVFKKPAYLARYCPKNGAKLATFCAVLRRFLEALRRANDTI